MTESKTVSVIENLVETVENGEKGFAEAADKLEKDGNPTLAAEMRELSQQRLRMSNELKEIAAAEGNPIDDRDGTVPGAMHRTYMALRDALTGDDPHAVLAAAEQGEDHAKTEFESALEEDLPVSVRSVVERQYGEVKTAHNRVRDLRDAHADN
ncbi:MAG TPA: PA2169 family four-helix-bundle protein [Acidimicrobiia bacterium]|nr:PA2169 family four-helix-bundle protein [Acidimicrobiia bacterium]